MELQVYINGKFFPKEKAVVSVFDHGFLYGDGVFEGIRSYDNRIFRFQEHIDRLYRSAKRISLEIPLTKEKLKEGVFETLRKNSLKNAYIRLLVSRGKGDLGLDPRNCYPPTIVIITDKIVLYPENLYKQGLEVVSVNTRRNSPNALDPQIKSLNYLNNILGKIEAINKNSQEGIMLNQEGLVTECTGDNIFIIQDGKLLTPPLYLGVLEGITRRIIMDMAQKFGISLAEEEFDLNRVYAAEECFLSGTAAEIIPVVKIDGRLIGSGRPGKTTLKLIEEFRKITRTEGTDIY